MPFQSVQNASHLEAFIILVLFDARKLPIFRYAVVTNSIPSSASSFVFAADVVAPLDDVTFLSVVINIVDRILQVNPIVHNIDPIIKLDGKFS